MQFVRMEAEKLERLHSTLMKLAPRGKVGGLGYASQSTRKVGRDETLPNNALYNNFVRAGSNLGQYHKKRFDNDDENNINVDLDDAKIREKKRKGKRKKEKQDQTKEGTAEATNEAYSHFDTVEDDMRQEKNKKKKRRKNKSHDNIEAEDTTGTDKEEDKKEDIDVLCDSKKRKSSKKKNVEARNSAEEDIVEREDKAKIEKKIGTRRNCQALCNHDVSPKRNLHLRNFGIQNGSIIFLSFRTPAKAKRKG